MPVSVRRSTRPDAPLSYQMSDTVKGHCLVDGEDTASAHPSITDRLLLRWVGAAVATLTRVWPERHRCRDPRHCPSRCSSSRSDATGTAHISRAINAEGCILCRSQLHDVVASRRGGPAGSQNLPTTLRMASRSARDLLHLCCPARDRNTRSGIETSPNRSQAGT